MSLFKVRNFWSLALDQLQQEDSQQEARGNIGQAGFVVDVGRFHSIGQHQVFVCASLRGLVFVVQVPDSTQTDVRVQNGTQEAKPDNHNSDGLKERQILLAKQLEEPVIDLKCGFFLSALKQSIALLSANKLHLYQVKRWCQTDLLTSGPLDGQTLDEGMFSHRLELQIQLDCMESAIAVGLVLLDQHSASKLNREGSSSSRHHRNLASRNDKSDGTQEKLLLPQRDVIAVQYTNQFVFTLVEHKKVIGHYDCSISASQDTDSDQQRHLIQLALLSQSVGPMPMAFLRDRQMLILSHSDNIIRAVPIQKLVSQAKQGIMQRVAAHLLQDKLKEKPSNLAYDRTKDQPIVRIDLEANAEWNVDMVLVPIQMQSLSQPDGSCQLIVMSRYSLSLISSGEILWSQRYEAPLICFHSYCVSETPNNPTSVSQEQGKVMTLLSSDCLGQDKSNLLVLNDQTVVWSALLAQKPIQIWRMHLSKMTGVLASIGVSDSQLLVSYFGTNAESEDEELLLNEDINAPSAQPALELVDDSLFGEDSRSSRNGDESIRQTKQRLSLEVQLDASNHWPNVVVKCELSIKPATSSNPMLQNIIVTLQFDDLIEFEHDGQKTSGGPLNISLGTCWPDRREPLVLTGIFSLKSIPPDPLRHNVPDLRSPKSLKIDVLIRYIETTCGPCLQEEFFMLPLDLVAQLVHIDYSSGLNQSLEDIQSNLNGYRRQPSLSYIVDKKPHDSPYFLCDLFVKVPCEMIELIEEIIESDLVCRGLNSEFMNYKLDERKDWKAGTLENINLLAQSLDCRLKYKSLSHPSTSPVVKQSSEDQTPIVMVSFAFKMQSSTDLIESTSTSDDEGNPYAQVWLHLCDLSAANTNLPVELVKQHTREWKLFDLESDSKKQAIESSHRFPILITIESDHPSPVLFLQDHLKWRIERRLIFNSGSPLHLNCLSRVAHDQFESDQYQLARHFDFIAISDNLHEALKVTMYRYEESLRPKFDLLKKQLNEEQSKFYISTMTAISMAKRLASLPENLQDQFGKLTKLTDQYHQNLMRTLHDLENLRALDYRYSKVPKAEDIVIERESGKLEKWPNYVQTMI